MQLQPLSYRTEPCRTSSFVLICLFVLLCSASSPSFAAHDQALQFHWQDQFSQNEQAKVKSWLRETHAALEQLVGSLPFTTQLYIHRTEAGEPVPWANTERSRIQGVHFHIDPRYSLDEFRADWTAPHELSHLVLPYLGRSNSWFAEGFASYMQYQVMHQMGVITAQDMRTRYQKNVAKAARRYSHHDTPFASAAGQLRAERNYPTMYWGGATLFLQADTWLMQETRSGLVAALKRYTQCCRMQDHKINILVTTLDRLTGSNKLSELLTQFKTQPGFPKFKNLHLGPSTTTASTTSNSTR